MFQHPSIFVETLQNLDNEVIHAPVQFFLVINVSLDWHLIYTRNIKDFRNEHKKIQKAERTGGRQR